MICMMFTKILMNTIQIKNVREKIIDAFESKIFLTKSKGSGFLNFDRSKLKIFFVSIKTNHQKSIQ